LAIRLSNLAEKHENAISIGIKFEKPDLILLW